MGLTSFRWTLGLGTGYLVGVVASSWSENFRLENNSLAGDILLLTTGIIAVLVGISLDIFQRRTAAPQSKEAAN